MALDVDVYMKCRQCTITLEPWARVWSDGINKLSPDVSCVRPVSAPSCETAGIHLQVLGPIGDLHCSNCCCCCCVCACVHAHLGPWSGTGNKGTAAGPCFSHLLSFLPLGSAGLLVVVVVLGEGGRGKAGTGHRGSLRTGGRACESNFPVVTVLPVSAERPAWGLQSKCDSVIAALSRRRRTLALCTSIWGGLAIDCADGFECHCMQPGEQTCSKNFNLM